MVRQTNRLENEYAIYKEGEQPVHNTQEPAVGVKEAATSNEGLRKTTNKYMGMMATSTSQANTDTEMKKPTYGTLKKIRNNTARKLN